MYWGALVRDRRKANDYWHLKVVHGEAKLFEIIAALNARRGLADLLHGRQEQADEDGDDGDHHKQFNEREACAEGIGKNSTA